MKKHINPSQSDVICKMGFSPLLIRKIPVRIQVRIAYRPLSPARAMSVVKCRCRVFTQVLSLGAVDVHLS